MATIYLIDGEKGGVGKSLFCRCLLHFLEQKKIPHKLVDSDPKPDVAQIYNGINDIQFTASDEATVMYSPTAGEVDKIIELAMQEDIIVNLPGKVHQQVKFWIEGNNLLDENFIKETKINFCKFFLSNGSDTSLDLLEDSLKTYQGKIPHILVRNKGLKLDWSDVINSARYKTLQSDHQFLEIDFPGLRRMDVDFIDARKQPFSKVMKELPLLTKQRVKTFLSDTMAAIETTGKFQVKS